MNGAVKRCLQSPFTIPYPSCGKTSSTSGVRERIVLILCVRRATTTQAVGLEAPNCADPIVKQTYVVDFPWRLKYFPVQSISSGAERCMYVGQRVSLRLAIPTNFPRLPRLNAYDSISFFSEGEPKLTIYPEIQRTTIAV